MRMKKIFLVLTAMFCVATVSAQKTKWAAGLRATYGVQAVAEYFYSADKYVEGRLGIFGGACADFTAIHQWNCCNWDWTPSVGKWYLDAGVGANLGGAAHSFWAGVAGDVKFGIKFNKVPIRLSVDYTPVIGYNFAAGHFHTPGFYNVALSATWHF